MPEKPKPSLNALLAQATGARKRRSKRGAMRQQQQPAPLSQPPVPGPIIEKRPAELVRALLVRRFVTAYLKEDVSAAAAARMVKPNLSPASSRVAAHGLLECEDVKAELLRQLRGIAKHADLNEEWVKSQYRAMAHSDIFEYIESIDAGGKVKWKLDPDQLTAEQRLNIRSLKIDAKTGTITHIGLVDRQAAVDSIAKVLRMFSLLDDTGMKDMAKEIAERMQLASKRIPRTFDGETGEEIE